MGRSRSVLILVLAAFLSACAGGIRAHGTTGYRVTASGREPREIYSHGETMMKRGLYDKAVEDFQELRNFHRDDPLSVRAELALGEIRFRKGEFEEARYAFEDFLTYHPRHPDLDYVVYMIGLSIWRQAPKLAGRDQSTTEAAARRWAGFRTRFPDSEHTESVEVYLQKAVDRLAANELWTARFYRKRAAWSAVAGRAERILLRFPESRHAEEAMAMLAEASQGIGKTLDAEAARDRLVERYPESTFIARVERALSRPPGTPPEDVVFARPYRMAGLNQPLPPSGPPPGAQGGR